MSPSSTSSSEDAAGAAAQAVSATDATQPRGPSPGHVTPDGLVSCPPDLLRGRGARALAVFITTLFLGALVVTGVVDTLYPLPRPTLEGLEKREDEQLRADAHFGDGSLASLIEYDRRITSPSRKALSQPYSRALFRWFDIASEDVLVGKDNWIFMRSRAVIPTSGTPEERGVMAAVHLAALDRLLASRGTRLAVVPVPRKAVVYADKLPDDIVPGVQIEASFEQQLARRGVIHAPLLERYRQDRRNQPGPESILYYQLDGHWTHRAALSAAEEIAVRSGLWDGLSPLAGSIRPHKQMTQDVTTLTYAGLDWDEQAFAWMDISKVDRFDTYDAQGKRIRVFQNPPQIGKVVLTGTSFSARRKLPHYLSHFAGETVTNVARPGGNPLDPIFDLLRETEPGTPEILVLELPGHHSLLSRSTRQAVELYAEFPPSQQMLLFGNEIWNRPQRSTPGPFPIAWAQPIASLPEGLVAHDGEGLVAVRLRGKLSGGSLRIDIRCAGARHDVLWPEGQEQLIIPVLTASATSELLVAVAVPQQTSPPYAVLDLHSVELIAALDESRAVSARARRGARLGMFPRGTIIPPHGGLLVRLRRAESLPEEVVLYGVVDGAERELGRYPGIARRGLIAVSLSALAGAELRSVRATGLDASRLIGRISLLPME